MIAIERRRVMDMRQPTYVTDGLVFHLDGINKGETDGYWTDLVGGISFDLSTATSNNDSVSFTSSSDVKNTSNSLLLPIETCHLEIVMTNWTSSSYALVFIKNTDKQIACGFFQRNILGVTNGTGLATFINPTPSTSGLVMQFSYNNSGGYCKGVATTRGASSYWSTSSNNGAIHIGKRSIGNNYTGKIYSIRIYNRHLTEEEVINNYNVDKIRFNIT